jgi:DtxR family Mn-dependent transcriptional regulator
MHASKPARRASPECCSIAHSAVVEDYLKAIFALASREDVVTTSALASQLGVAPPSASAMLKRLEVSELIHRSDDFQIQLSEHGRRHALGIVRRHRLVEVFLVEVLGVPWDEVHAEAEVLEHAVSARLEQRIDALLNHPTHDPHGDPIPPSSGEHVEDWANPLATAAAGARFMVERVSDRDSDVLRHLAGLGVRPGVILYLIEWAPFGGPLWVELDGRKLALGSELVRVIHGRTI